MIATLSALCRKKQHNKRESYYICGVQLFAMTTTLLQITPKPTKARRPKAPEQEILDYIGQFATLSLAEAQAVLDSLNIRKFKKGTVLLREGQITKFCHFVLKGCVRQYFLVDGLEKTTNFYTEGQPIAPYEGNGRQQPSKYYLACVEDCLLTTGTPEQEAQLYEMFPRLRGVGQLAVEDEWSKAQDQFASFVIHSPEDRYLHLLNTRPDLLDRVPQYQLASYLGITPESLSRIRKRVAGK